MFATLNDDQIDKKLKFIDAYKSASNAASGAKYDANANVTQKNIATMSAEINKDINIQINRKIMVSKIEELFGVELAREYVRQLESHEIYCHDETSLAPYCMSISMYPFLLDGLKSLGGESGPPKHVDSFCGSFINMVFAISAQIAGALATVEWLMYFDHFLRKDYGDDYVTTHPRELENHMQHIVYSINQPAAARGYQSVFWNISVYDQYYFEGLFGDFCFPDGTVPSWESVKKLQEVFMTWFNKEREKSLLTFPIVTAAMLIDGEKPKDQEFADMCAKQMSEGNSFFVYMSDSADSLASCCLTDDTEIVVNGKTLNIKEFVESYKSDVQYEIDSLNPNTLDVEKTRVVGVLRKHTQTPIVTFELEDGTSLSCTTDHVWIVRVDGEICEMTSRQLAQIRLPVEFITIKDANFVKLKAASVESKNVEVYDIELEKNHYFTANGTWTHNCRLRNEISDNTFSFSLGAGGVATGSINVITVNMNRLIQDGRDLLTEIQKVQKYQVAYRKLTEEYKAANMLPVYDAGYISIDKQYLTIGINGMVEAAEYLGIDVSDNEEYKQFVASQLKVIYDANKVAKKEYGYMFNTEFVPAENLGVKNATWDRQDGYVVPRDCYNSYFYVVEDDAINHIDKFTLHGTDIIKYLDGGSALHLNLAESMSFEGYRKLLNVAAKSGCNYFCINVLTTMCNSCDYIDKQTRNSCSKCGSEDVDHATRVIGYLKRISSFSSSRQREAHRRFYHAR